MRFHQVLAATILAFSASLFIGCAEEKPSQNAAPVGTQQAGKGGGQRGMPAPPPIEPIK